MDAGQGRRGPTGATGSTGKTSATTTFSRTILRFYGSLGGRSTPTVTGTEHYTGPYGFFLAVEEADW